jgi:hypothetical protein
MSGIDIKESIEMLNSALSDVESADPAQQLKGLRQIRTVLSDAAQPPFDDLIGSNCVPYFVDLMRDDAQPVSASHHGYYRSLSK